MSAIQSTFRVVFTVIRSSLIIFMAYATFQVIYNRWLHPLAKYPGPFLWTVFRWPFCSSLVRGRLAHDIKAHHERYGLVVRVAPNELSFIDSRAWKDIHGHQKNRGPEFPKNPIWAQPAPNGVKSILNADYEAHGRMRKPLLNAFRPGALRKQETLMRQYVESFVGQLRGHAEAGNGSAIIDMKDYFSWTTFDMIGDLGFGEPFNCLKEEKYHPWVSFLFGHLKAGALRAAANYYPGIATILLWLTPKAAFQRAREHHDMSCDKLDRRISMETDRRDIISYILETNDAGGMTMPELQATSAALILAGSEGISTCLIATTNLLLRNPEKLRKLTNEIRSSFAESREISSEALESLPYLKAVLQEGLRMAPPVPIGIPRIVPSIGGTVCGERLPPNTFVSVPQFAAYRSKDNFCFPDAFIPERWLSPDSGLLFPSRSDPVFDGHTFTADVKDVLQPFSVGPRDCVGRLLGIMELRLILTHLLWNFDLMIPNRVPFRDFEDQKTFALWERLPFKVEVASRES